MKRLRSKALLAGLALIAASNLVALGGVAYNRSGEAESRLNLTQRELSLPPAWQSRQDSSGLQLSLNWRTLPRPSTGSEEREFYALHDGSPSWLNALKLQELGFDLPERPQGFAASHNPSTREVLIVLEQDGPAYQAALAEAQQALGRAEQKDDAGKARKAAQTRLDAEMQQSSRLFAVDAGLDLATLRRLHPDRQQYAIVRGRLRLTMDRDGRPVGRIEGLGVGDIHVPLAQREAIGDRLPAGLDGATRPAVAFEATLAFGRRLEPWLVQAQASGHRTSR